VKFYLQQTVTRVIQDVRPYGTLTYDIDCIVTWSQEHWTEIDWSRSAGFDFPVVLFPF